MTARWEVGVDVGGTFVDLVARRLDQPEPLRATKHLRQGEGPAAAVLAALLGFLKAEGIDAQQVARLRHGSTIATNTLLERREAPVVLVTTQGFADVPTLGRQHRRHMDAAPEAPVADVLCPSAWRVEVGGRIDAQGQQVAPLPSLAPTVEAVAALAPPAVAVCLLHAPLNPAHELAVGAALRARLPGMHVALSHQVDPRPGEYERSLTTLLDAYAAPSTAGYLAALAEGLAAAGLPAPWVAGSAGALVPLAEAIRRPVALALSGPAAAALAVARLAGGGDAIGLDVGGTSTDVCLVTGGVLLLAREVRLGALSARLAAADVASLAIGGGSLVQQVGGLLRVGPHSAGAAPGPACYGRGGTRPTLTDCALLAGLLPPSLGGTLTLDMAAAARALGGLDAWGAMAVAEAAMAEAARRHAFGRGVDPRGAVLVAAGGGGALHAAKVAEAMGCTRVLVPAAPGVLAAHGLLLAEAACEAEHSLDLALQEGSLPQPAEAALAAKLLGWLPNASVRFRHELLIGHQGQGSALAVEFAPGQDDASILAARFEAAMRRLRGHGFATPRRLKALRSVASAALAEAPPDTWRRVAMRAPLARGGHTVIARSAISAGQALRGPLLVDAADTTIRIPAGWQALAQDDGALLLTWGVA